MKQSQAMVFAVLVSVIGVSAITSSAQATQKTLTPKLPTCEQAKRACERNGGTFNSRDGTINPFNNTASHSCATNGKKTTGQHRRRISCDKKSAAIPIAPVSPDARTTAPKTPGIQSTPQRGGMTRPQLPGGKRPRPGTTPDARPMKPMGKKGLGVKGLGAQYVVAPDTLNINASTGPVSVAVGGTASVNWNLATLPSPPSVPPRGVHLLVDTAPFPADNCAQNPPTTGSPDNGFKRGAPTGTYALSLTNPYYVVGKTYYVKGCIFGRVLGALRYTGLETNMVELRYVPKPDLVITSMLIHENKLRFIVKNHGQGPTPTGQTIKFNVSLGAPERPAGGGGSSSPDGTTTYYGPGTVTSGPGGGTAVEGIAERTSSTPLQPNQTVEERPLGIQLPLNNQRNDRLHLTVCINRDKNGRRQIDETNLSNNCRTRPLADMLPDLTVRITGVRLLKPDGFWDDFKDFVGGTFEGVTPDSCADSIQVSVTNHGKTLSMPNSVQGRLGGVEGATYGLSFMQIPAIAPGESEKVTFCFRKNNPLRYELGGCAKWALSAYVDVDKKLAEAREDNNGHETSAQKKNCN